MRDKCVEQGFIAIIVEILMKEGLSKSIVRNTSWALANMCRNKPMAPVNYLQEAFPALAKVFLENDDIEVVIDILWAFSYVSDAHDSLSHAIASSGVVPKLLTFLEHNNIQAVVAALRTVGNVLV